ncbi:MAG: histidinol dehydrogenase [Firmicutes bacterium]|nr:histidinol dehydrogenase [Bacillota bacterium]
MLPILEFDKNNLKKQKVFARRNTHPMHMDEMNESVREIIAEVCLNGDKALFAYTKKFDGYDLNAQNILLTKEEMREAVNQVPQETLLAMRRAKENITAYHQRQLKADNFATENGAGTGFMYRPVSRAGIYVPGGKAAYPSSVLMCTIPAVVAGVKEIIMVTPPGKYLNPLTIAAAYESGVTKIFRVGGAQAVAALAYGTKSVPRVDVIAGPGNYFVTEAKRQVFGQVGIDMLAGPSEILIIADSTANPEFIAADMLSQAEHDELAQSILLTTDRELAECVNLALEKQLNRLPRKEIAGKSLQKYGSIVVCKNLSDAALLSNRVAPEHLELCVADPEKLLEKIQNAGAVFIGNYSPEPLGDYYAGTNHVLPTTGTARFSSGLGVDTFLKRISVINYTKEALSAAADDIITLAETEQLSAHAESIRVRQNDC